MVEILITKTDVETGESAMAWFIKTLNKFGGSLERGSFTEADLDRAGLLRLGYDLAPLIHRLRDFLAVAPTGVGIIAVADDCDPKHVCGATWLAETAARGMFPEAFNG